MLYHDSRVSHFDRYSTNTGENKCGLTHTLKTYTTEYFKTYM